MTNKQKKFAKRERQLSVEEITIKKTEAVENLDYETFKKEVTNTTILYTSMQ